MAGNLPLSIFQAHDFDCHRFIRSHCIPLEEQGIETLCMNLLKLKMLSTEEMRLNVLSNYHALMRTLQKIAGLEGCLTSMQNLLLSKSALVHTLIKCGRVSVGLQPKKPKLSDNLEDDLYQRSILNTLDQLDMFLVDQNVREAVKALQQGENLVHKACLKDIPTNIIHNFQEEIDKRRSKLVNELVGTTKKISVHGVEARNAIAALIQLKESVMGHNLLLDLYHKRIKAGLNDLHPSGTLSGGLYTAGLSQCVFSGILNAVRSASAIFGDDTEFSSKLVLWAYKEIEDFVSLLRKHVLLVSRGLKAMVECIRIAHGHCLLLESYGLALCPFLTGALRPTILCMLQRCIVHIQETVLCLAAADYWLLEIEPKSEVSTSREVSQRHLCRSGGKKKTTYFELPEKLTYSAYHLDMLAMELFVRLSTISQCIKKVLTGWKKVVSLPLLNFLKGVLLWLKNFDSFWMGFETYKDCLQPEGCVQLVFDLHFVAQFASDGDYLSKSVQNIISDMICSAEDIYARHDHNPQSFMPNDDWFKKETQRALQEVILRRIQ